MSTASPQPTNEHLQTLMTGYVLNALPSEEIAELESYFQQQPELLQQLQEYQEVIGLLAHSVQQPAPAHLRDQILALPQRVSDSTAPVRPAPVKRTLPFRQLAWAKMAGSIAAMILLGLGIQNYFLQQRLHSLEAEIKELQEQEIFSFDLKGTQAAKNAAASIILDLTNGQALLAVQNLPPLPAGESYHLWAFTANEKILCGQFNMPASGQWVSHLSIPVEEYTSHVKFMRISREPSTPSLDPGRQVLVMTSES